MVLANRKLKLREIADTLKISGGSLLTILREHLSMRKFCSKWVRCLELFQSNKDFFMRYVTMDETWIQYYSPESNRQLAEWKAKG